MSKDTNKWGNPRANQVSARYSTYVKKPDTILFFIPVEREVYTTFDTKNGDEVPDDVKAKRTFLFTCGLIKAINVLAGTKSVMTLYLDGFSNVDLTIGNTAFEFDPELEEPTATLLFESEGKRFEQTSRTDKFVTMTFRDREQMQEYVIATTTEPDPKKVTRYRSRNSSGMDSGSSALWPLAVGIGVGIALS